VVVRAGLDTEDRGKFFAAAGNRTPGININIFKHGEVSSICVLF
jgi:hypothetical protein